MAPTDPAAARTEVADATVSLVNVYGARLSQKGCRIARRARSDAMVPEKRLRTIEPACERDGQEVVSEAWIPKELGNEGENPIRLEA